MSREPRVLVIDNFDSFAFNLVDAFACLGAEVEVYRNDIGADEALALAAAEDIGLIVLSPGPGTPATAGCCMELAQRAAGRVPLFGVCLGHQVIATAFGGEVGAAPTIVHGKKTRIRHRGHPLFAGLDRHFEAGRYHSLIALGLPPGFDAIAECAGQVMALAHPTLPVWGVQFHPESILTTHGQRLLGNVLALAAAYPAGAMQ
ncbi:MAG TPA: aminodeoxychorismate/anthranilate synthase component II [Rhodanobacteraceae bacterium]|nr:aminodeoxychorismate/anthranilate synthase component II [Rhodanobacteraceae bacterium]